MIGVQREITERAIELLRLPDCYNDDSAVPSLVLDIGCGSGLSGQVLEEKGQLSVKVENELQRHKLNFQIEKEKYETQFKKNFAQEIANFD